MGVRTARVERRNLSRDIRTVGLVGYEEPRQYLINSKNSGWIEKLHVAQTGQQVKKGQALLEFYSPDLVSAQEEYLLALNNSEALKNSPFPDIAAGAERLLAASRQRLVFWDVSESQIRALARDRQAQKTLTLYAAHSGIVTEKLAIEGMFVKPGMDLFKISDISSVWVYADIYENELAWVKEGQSAEVELPFAGGRTIAGRVSTVYPYVEPKTRTVKARIDLKNPNFELRPAMYVNVRIKTQTVQDALTVPAEAILHSGEKQTVFVALGNGKFEPRQVKTGVRGQDGMVEIRQGVLDQEKIVTSAQFLFDSESKLREAIQKMLEPKQDETPVESAGEQNLDDLFN
jgi:membrane fusion protein, copper/silver efflux system